MTDTLTSEQGETSASATYSSAYPLSPSAEAGPSDAVTYPTALPPEAIPTTRTLIGLGGTPDQPLLKLPVIGVNAWAWGDGVSYGWGATEGGESKLDPEHVSAAFDELTKIHPKLFLDVAEHYGHDNGYAEQSIGWNLDKRFTLAERDKRVIVATKFLPSRARHPYTYPDVVLEALEGSLDRTQIPSVDIYQLEHASSVWPRLETLADGLARCYEAGKVKTIGTCNLNISQVRWMHEYFTKRNVPYVSNQVEFSLLHMAPWKNGLIEESKKLGIATIAYSPLGVARLTGKYSAENPPKGNRRMTHIPWSKIQPIVDELAALGEVHGKTPGAVALNWVMCKGAIPIPSVKNAEQARDCAEALGWRLTPEEVAGLDTLGIENEWDWNLWRHFQNFCYDQAKYYPVVAWSKPPFARSPKWSSPFVRR